MKKMSKVSFVDATTNSEELRPLDIGMFTPLTADDYETYMEDFKFLDQDSDEYITLKDIETLEKKLEEESHSSDEAKLIYEDKVDMFDSLRQVITEYEGKLDFPTFVKMIRLFEDEQNEELEKERQNQEEAAIIAEKIGLKLMFEDCSDDSEDLLSSESSPNE